MKTILFFLLASMAALVASDFERSETCKTCHPVIYDEFYDSSHRKSSIHTDPVHKAVWDQHPLKEKEKYSCAKCHTPADIALMNQLEAGKSAIPQDNKIQREEGISCVYCHAIERVETHAKANRNILTDKKRVMFSAREGKEGEEDVSFSMKSSFFGLMTEKSGSPYHKIDYTNKGFYDGKMCMGCHSHKQNSAHFSVCETEIESDAADENNCISCHMPMVQGSFSTVKESQTHRYHGFSGVANKPKMLSEYIGLTLKKEAEGFAITIKNEANHAFLLHPLRLAQLRVSVQRDGVTTKLDSHSFARVIGKDGKPAMPWLADSVIRDNQIQAKESRVVSFAYGLKAGDTVEAQIGFYAVNPKAAKKLQIEGDPAKFTLLKKERFSIGR